jgi:hypothetical protein
VTPLPDWLVERAALEEVAPVSRERIDRADPKELAARMAELQAQNEAELAAYPAAQAMALIEARVARLRQRRRRTRLAWLGLLGAATAAVVIVAAIKPPEVPPTVAMSDDVRAKGVARLNVYRQAGDHAEHLDEDALVREGDAIQVRYSASGALYGVIASVDGAGAVTLHYPVDEDAPALATALAPKPTSLPNAYVLDNAPRFERFFFITSADPIEVPQSIAALRALAARGDSETGRLELPAGQHQWSVRLRKPDRQPQ